MNCSARDGRIQFEQDRTARFGVETVISPLAPANVPGLRRVGGERRDGHGDDPIEGASVVQGGYLPERAAVVGLHDHVLRAGQVIGDRPGPSLRVMLSNRKVL